MTDVAGDGGEVLVTQDRALVPMSLGCWASFPWRKDEGRACGDVSIPPSSVKGGSSTPVYPSIPTVSEFSQAPREQRVRNGVGSEEGRAVGGRSGQRHCWEAPSPLRGAPQRCTVVSSPPPGPLLDIFAWIPSLMTIHPILRREHPAPQGLIQL